MPGSFESEMGTTEHGMYGVEEYHCPACTFGPEAAEEVLVHIITNHEID